MAAPPSPTRRVLADKTPNASIKCRAYETLPKQQADCLMRDERTISIECAVDTKGRMTLTPKAGQKRRIQDVDGTEDQEQQRLDRGGSASPRMVLPTEPTSEADERDFISTAQTRSTTSTLLTSFHASQDPSMPVEDQFDIQEEMSQRTLDKIHATPIPNDTSQLQPPLPPALVAETSQDSVRMSSFIDFEAQESEKDKPEMISAEPNISAEKRLGKEAVLERAEALRTRLQLAFYKVQTNQIGKPFSTLDQPRCLSPELPPRPSSLRRTSPEGIVAAARARATQQKKPAVTNLNSLPIPTIVPTAYSARPMLLDVEEARAPASALWSPSGMFKRLGKDVRSVERPRTSTWSQADRTPFPKTPMQLSSPPRSDVGGPVFEHGQGGKVVGGLTSSVVKGEAANGLLELMRAAAA